MPHDHSHHHHHHLSAEAGDRRMWLAVAVNLLLTVAQIVGGVLSGSLALIADALHNLSDAISLVIAFAARRIARRPADARMTFGYGRVEVVAALINYTTLILLALYLAYEGVMRIFAPEPVAGWWVVGIAALALVVDAITALLTWSMAKESVNIRAAFLHNMADALGSVAVIVAGGLILAFGWVIADPIITLLIAGYILWHGLSEIGGVIRILMLGAPEGADLPAIIAALEAEPGVEGVHHLHLWQMQEHEVALEGHVVTAGASWAEAEALRRRLKALLRARFDIAHVTLEMEAAGRGCQGPQQIGHG